MIAIESEDDESAAKAARAKLVCADSIRWDMACGAKIQPSELLSVMSAAAGASIISAKRATKLRAKSRPRSRELISRARLVSDSALRRCCSESERFRLTSRATVTWAARARARL